MTDQKRTHLTKTLYVNGLACAKSLWLAFNDPDRLPKVNASTQHRFDEGRQIGELARRRYPKGVLLPSEGPRENDLRSRTFLEKRVPLFEAGLFHRVDACYARADVLLPAGKHEWDVIEVKSGGSVTEEYLHDVAFQRYCYASAGLRIRRCALLLVNTMYERSGEIDLDQLFKDVDVTAVAAELEPRIEPNVAALLATARLDECPQFGSGEQFHNDEAGVHDDDLVWKQHPDSDIQGLYRGGKQTLQFLESGIYRIRDIPKSVVLKGRQVIQHAAHSSGQVHLDRKEIAAFLAKLRYPLHYLDFETVGTAVPLFDGVKPYQQIPFQFSVHVVEAPGEKPRAHSFLTLEPTDPREMLLRALQQSIGPEGSLVAYNQAFEKTRLKELAALFPEQASWVRGVDGRFVDLLAPFREFAYYSPLQSGSASLKAVLPAVTGRGYEGFDIANGGQASLAYLYAAFGTPDGERASSREVEEIRKGLDRVLRSGYGGDGLDRGETRGAHGGSH